MKLSSLKRPFVCLVVSEPTRARTLGIIEAYEGEVDAFEVNLAVLERKTFRDIFSSTKRPCIATNRRASFMKFYGYNDLITISDKLRVKRLDAAVAAGAAVVDYELDILDESRQRTKPAYLSPEEKAYASKPASEPVEFSRDGRVIRKQVELVRQAKQTGIEVLFSCHTQTVITRSQCAEIISSMSERGADLGKVVSLTPSTRDISSFIDTVVSMKETSRIPFNLMNVGSESILGRLLSARLGSAWVYCRPNSGKTFRGQPTVDDVKGFLAITDPDRESI